MTVHHLPASGRIGVYTDRLDSPAKGDRLGDY